MRTKLILRWFGIAVLTLTLVSAGLAVFYLLEKAAHTWRSREQIEQERQALAKALAKHGGAAQADRFAGVILAAVRKGQAYLKAHQEEDGHFVTGILGPKASFTALAVLAFLNSPDRYQIQDHPFLQRAVAALAEAQHPSGAIYRFPTASFSNYSTSLGVLALKATGDPKYDAAIGRAAAFLKDAQHTGDPNDPGAGGTGYNKGSRADMNNTMTMLEALKGAGIPEDDPAFKRAAEFITRSQNNPETNPEAWADGSPGQKGGFIYRPAESPAGSTTDREGQVRYASYGTMGYAGLISFLYANVGRDDPRVRSAFAWIQRHYDLHENVNMKDVGLFYYYRIMAKALDLYGEQYIVTPDGIRHDWARDLARHLVGLQNEDGSWVNANTTYFEGDRVMVTAYAVHALSICYERVAGSASGDQ